MPRDKSSFCKKYDGSRTSANTKWMADRWWCSCKNYEQMTKCSFYKKTHSTIVTSDKWRFSTACRWSQLWHGSRMISGSSGTVDIVVCTSREAAINLKLEDV